MSIQALNVQIFPFLLIWYVCIGVPSQALIPDGSALSAPGLARKVRNRLATAAALLSSARVPS